MQWLNIHGIDEGIQNIIVEKFSNEKTSEINENKEEQKQGIDKESMSKNIEENAKNEFVKTVAKPLSYNIVYGGVMIILFAISKIIIFFISALSETIANLPIIKQFNKTGGVLYGIIIGFFVVNVILLITSFFVDVDSNNKANEILNETYVTKIMYEYNIFKIFFVK